MSLGSQDRFLRERKMEGEKGVEGCGGGRGFLHRDVTQATKPSRPRYLSTKIMSVPYHGQPLALDQEVSLAKEVQSHMTLK